MKATVRIDQFGGQGVLVPGPFILTATHCVKWNGEGGMAMVDRHIETITSKDGAKLRVQVLAADPVSDIAVLGPLDNQEFYEQVEAFEQWCEATTCVPLTAKTPQRLGGTLDVHVLTHEDTWVTGKITRYGIEISGVMSIETDEQIKGGTSGGPVVDSSGRLVGVISHTMEIVGRPECHGMIPIAHLALPGWVWRRMGGGKRGVVVGRAAWLKSV